MSRPAKGTHQRPASTSLSRAVCCAVLPLSVAIATLSPGAHAAPATVVAEGWRVGFGYGSVESARARHSGRAATATLGYGARVVNERTVRWDFEVGLGYTETRTPLDGPASGALELNQTDLYYRARRLTSGNLFAGWHVALTRLSESPQHGESSRDLGVTAGAVFGWFGAGGTAVQLAALATDPGLDGIGIDFSTRQYRASIGVQF